MKSKSSLLAISVAGLLTLAPLARLAAAEPAASERGAAARERIQATLAELNLTPEQKAKLAPIIRAEMERIAAVRSDTGLSPREKLQQMKAIQEEVVPQVKAILTPEQFAKWEKKRAEARDEMQERFRQRQKR